MLLPPLLLIAMCSHIQPYHNQALRMCQARPHVELFSPRTSTHNANPMHASAAAILAEAGKRTFHCTATHTPAQAMMQWVI
jgi:hypothetical protein